MPGDKKIKISLHGCETAFSLVIIGMDTLRDYQGLAVEYATDFVRRSVSGSRLLLASPTGTGKSYMILALQDAFRGSFVVTPRIEIITSLLNKRGVIVNDLSEAAILDVSGRMNIYTPIRLRNLLLGGKLAPPPLLIMDEAHHDRAESWQDIHLLCGCPPAVGFTATPFRGTPKSTADFLKEWGLPVWAITFAEAAERGVLSMPHCSTVPLVDDDLIGVQNGELVAKQVNSVTNSRLREAADLATLDMPTMFSVPSVELTESLRIVLDTRGIPPVVVTGKTPYSERQEAFRACVECRAVLVQVFVVSEGVDLPIRRLIDLSPTLSPVKWLQQFGRITRPGGQSHYLCTNRNLMRHGYLLDGCLPPDQMKQSQAAFPPSQRDGVRAVGLESIGRLKAAELPLRDGLTGLLYAMSKMDGHVRTEYAAIVHPLRPEILWAEKRSIRDGESIRWGKWKRCDVPTDLSGFASLPPTPLTEKQIAWWKRAAASRGLDAGATITKKQFPVLPILSDLGIRL